jgi:hypothetical protein
VHYHTLQGRTTTWCGKNVSAGAGAGVCVCVCGVWCVWWCVPKIMHDIPHTYISSHHTQTHNKHLHSIKSVANCVWNIVTTMENVEEKNDEKKDDSTHSESVAQGPVESATNRTTPTPPVVKPKPKPEALIAYNGTTISTAASQGNLPVCVLLWGMASAKKQSLMVPDKQGNNPMHHACMAPTAEVLGFLIQQTRGLLTPYVKLIDSRNNNGETPLLRSVATGQMIVIKVSPHTTCMATITLILTYFRPYWMKEVMY